MDNRDFSEQTAKLRNQKKGYKFNIVDIILVLIVVVAAAALIYILGRNSLFSGDESVDILYTIEISQIRNELVPAISKIEHGTKVTDSVRSYFIGEVQNVKIEEAFANTTNLEKEMFEKHRYPDYSRVTIIVKAEKVIKDESGYSVNGRKIMVGERIDFRTPYFVSYGYCIDLDEIKRGDSVSNITGE